MLWNQLEEGKAFKLRLDEKQNCDAYHACAQILEFSWRITLPRYESYNNGCIEEMTKTMFSTQTKTNDEQIKTRGDKQNHIKEK
eukprot:669976-Amphidinium_carterae.1